MYKRKTPHVSACVRCGKLFSHKMPNAKYCSRRCRVRAYRARQFDWQKHADRLIDQTYLGKLRDKNANKD